MSKIFCPFVKGDCVPNCIFNNNCFGENDVENCNLTDVVKIIQSANLDLQVNQIVPSKYLKDIFSKLDYIETNTSSDPTSSSSISSTLDDIKKLLTKN